MHVSTRTCHIHHRRGVTEDKYFMCCRMYESDMTKPCSITNRSLAYCTLLGVLWQMCHAWITYGTVRRTVQTMGKLGGTSGKYQETCLFCMLLGPLWQSCHAWITYRSVCRVVVVTTDQVTCGPISHVQLGHAQQMDTCNKHTDVQNMHDKHMNCQNVSIEVFIMLGIRGIDTMSLTSCCGHHLVVLPFMVGILGLKRRSMSFTSDLVAGFSQITFVLMMVLRLTTE